jgi:hypothetical protein
LVFLASLFAYDVVALLHVHAHQRGLDQVASSYSPVHPILPLLGRPEPILPMDHAWWFVVLHGIGSAFPLLAVLMQLASPIREWRPALHRWNGRIVLVTTFLFAALPGVVMAPSVQHASPLLAFFIAGLGLLVAFAAVRAWVCIRRGQILAHARWGFRLATYLHVIPVVSRLYFWALWVTAAAPDPGETFESIGWLTVVTVVPLGELAAWLGTRREPGGRAGR